MIVIPYRTKGFVLNNNLFQRISSEFLYFKGVALRLLNWFKGIALKKGLGGCYVLVYINMAKNITFCRFYTFYLLEIGSKGLDSSGGFRKEMVHFYSFLFTMQIFQRIVSEFPANF